MKLAVTAVPGKSSMVQAIVFAATVLGGVAVAVSQERVAVREGNDEAARESPFTVRPFLAEPQSSWIGNGIAYSPYRDGQSPRGAMPTRDQLREDLSLLRTKWRLLRLYGSRRGPARAVLEIIRKEDLGLQVVLGSWIEPEARVAEDDTQLDALPDGVMLNKEEVAETIKLANEFPDIVVGAIVGSETQVDWSSHKVQRDVLIKHIREVRAATRTPVATADDFSYWLRPESRMLVREIDFVVVHIHPMWNKQLLTDALAFTQARFAAVRVMHPNRETVLGETGWATEKSSHGEQGELLLGAAGEDQQKAYFDRFTDWVMKQRITSFYFEAFDENWKGGNDPDDVEKHWGLFRADRTPKRAVRDYVFGGR